MHKRREDYDDKLTADRRSGLRFCFRKWNTIALEQQFVAHETVLVAMRIRKDGKRQRRSKLWRFLAKRQMSKTHGLRLCFMKWNTIALEQRFVRIEHLLMAQPRQAQQMSKRWMFIAHRVTKCVGTAFHAWLQHFWQYFHEDVCSQINKQVCRVLETKRVGIQLICFHNWVHHFRRKQPRYHEKLRSAIKSQIACQVLLVKSDRCNQ